MESLALVAAGTTALVWIAVIIREASRASWIRKLKDLARADRNRNRFGELRTRLMALAREGALNVRGSTFQVLYPSLTYLMREPQDYDKAAIALMQLPPKVANNGCEIVSREEVDLLLSLARCLDLLCRDYSTTYRFAAWIHDLSGRTNAPRWLVKYAARVRKVRDAQERLQSYGKYALAA